MVTAVEAAKLFGVSRHTIYRWLRQHEKATPVPLVAARSRGPAGTVSLYPLSLIAQLAAERHAEKQQPSEPERTVRTVCNN